MLSNGKIESLQLVKECLAELNQLWRIPGYDTPGAATPVYSAGSPLSSSQLIGLVALLEERIELQANRRVVLADERAMSRRHSPFRSVETLAEFVQEQLAEVEETTTGGKATQPSR